MENSLFQIVIYKLKNINVKLFFIVIFFNKLVKCTCLCFAGCYIEDTYVKTFDHFAHLPSYDVTPTDCITKCRKDGELFNLTLHTYIVIRKQNSLV